MLLAAAAVLALRGVRTLLVSPSAPPPKTAAPAESFDQGALLAVLAPPTPQAPAASAESGALAASAAARDPREVAYAAQANGLWDTVQRYQTACGLATPVTREQFLEGLRQSNLAGELAKRGSNYAESQLRFLTQSLSNPEVVRLCKSGKSGIFFATLEHHGKQWDAYQSRTLRMEVQEREREEAFNRTEELRVAMAQQDGYRLLTLAGGAFAAFMSLVLLLIFARIEFNLRGLRPSVLSAAGTPPTE